MCCCDGRVLFQGGVWNVHVLHAVVWEQNCSEKSFRTVGLFKATAGLEIIVILIRRLLFLTIYSLLCCYVPAYGVFSYVTLERIPIFCQIPKVSPTTTTPLFPLIKSESKHGFCSLEHCASGCEISHSLPQPVSRKTKKKRMSMVLNSCKPWLWVETAQIGVLPRLLKLSWALIRGGGAFPSFWPLPP